MLIQAISFEIHNVKAQIHEEFLVEATDENYEMILRHRFTRQIQFVKAFDFEFAHKEHTPKFIEFGNTVLEANSDNDENEIDEIDEMVGTF